MPEGDMEIRMSRKGQVVSGLDMVNWMEGWHLLRVRRNSVWSNGTGKRATMSSMYRLSHTGREGRAGYMVVFCRNAMNILA